MNLPTLVAAVLNQATTSPIPSPSLLSATFDSAGIGLVLVWSEATSGVNLGLTLNRVDGPVALQIDNGAETDTWTVIIDGVTAVYDDEPLTLTYVPGDIASFPGGIALGAFTGFAITNNSTVPCLLIYDGDTSTTFDTTGKTSITSRCWGAGAAGDATLGGGGGGYGQANSAPDASVLDVTISSGIASVAVQGGSSLATGQPGIGRDGGGADIGDVAFSGGAGGDVVGGGGGSAGASGNGGDGGDGVLSSSAGAGGAAGANGGAAGGAGSITGDGENGAAPGGGGGASVASPGTGAPARIIITWSY